MPDDALSLSEGAGSNPSIAAALSPSLTLTLFAVLVAVIGGFLGILGALVQELQAGGGGGSILGAIVVAPVIEEALKPAGIFILLVRWPAAVGGRVSIALLTALSGLIFGIVESIVYVTLYFPDASSDLIAYRFSVTLALHASASFIMGLGLSRSIIDWAAGRSAFPRRTRNFYAGAVALHAVYNTTTIVLALAGVLDLD